MQPPQANKCNQQEKLENDDNNLHIDYSNDRLTINDDDDDGDDDQHFLPLPFFRQPRLLVLRSASLLPWKAGWRTPWFFPSPRPSEAWRS